MPKDDLVYAGHMLEMADKAVALVHDKDRGAYDQDEVLRLALTHLVQTVGEAPPVMSRRSSATNTRRSPGGPSSGCATEWSTIT
jgi:uncharacterized protein with HEPN domain